MSHRTVGRHLASRWHWIASIISGLGLSFCVSAEPVGLLYPDVRDPYQKVFLNIVEGAESQLKSTTATFVITSSTEQTDIQAWIKNNNIEAVIALSSQTTELLVGETLPLVVGAIAAQEPTQYSSVSLNPSPEHLFKGLLVLKPAIKTIHVVYDSDRNQWEIDQAEKIANKLGLSLTAYSTDDLRDAAIAYRDIQKNMDANKEALWLPLGGPSRDKSIIQNILETAWVKDQVVFSSNLADVKRGVLFAMYPDNVGMGKELVQLLQEVQKNPDRSHEARFVTSLFKAVNRRTAEHLNIRLSNQDLSGYDFVYPPK